jgi:hypothetical protein
MDLSQDGNNQMIKSNHESRNPDGQATQDMSPEVKNTFN